MTTGRITPTCKRSVVPCVVAQVLAVLALCATLVSPVRASGFNFTTFDHPLAGQGANKGTLAADVFGINVTGWYVDSAQDYHAFIYNGSAYTPLNGPLGATDTFAGGIDGTNVVGNYYDSSSVSHGFLFDGSSYTTLDHPLAGPGTAQGAQDPGRREAAQEHSRTGLRPVSAISRARRPADRGRQRRRLSAGVCAASDPDEPLPTSA